MSFQQGLSGLNAASKSLEAIGNNVANAGTVGFKQSQVQFSDVYASSLIGAGGGAQVGIGTQVARVAQQFSQGNVTASNNPLDMAINGDGFFRMSSNGVLSYTRNGQFMLSEAGYIENASGSRLTGRPANADGEILNGEPQELRIIKGDLKPQATANYELALTLNSDKPVSTTPFSPTDPLSYADSTTASVYDSLGNEHLLRTFYAKSAPDTTGTTWTVYATTDNDVPLGPPSGVPGAALGTMRFDTSGRLAPLVQAPLQAQMGVALGPLTPYDISINHFGSQQFAQDFGVANQNPDGYPAGTLASFSVSTRGEIVGRYTNGETQNLGQVVISSFRNPNGLQNIGDNQWVETAESGEPKTLPPGSSGLGVVQSSRVEDSNVDLTAELVNMITAQRYYQANAQTIKTQDQILQTLVNLR